MRYKGIINIKDYPNMVVLEVKRLKEQAKIDIISSVTAHILQNPEYVVGRNHTIA